MVQEKALAFPNDARLYHKDRLSLVRMASRFWHSPAAAKSALSQQAQRHVLYLDEINDNQEMRFFKI
jgi:hypothetical protein